MDAQSEILAKSFVPEGAPTPRAPLTPEQQRINTAAVGKAMKKRKIQITDLCFKKTRRRRFIVVQLNK